MKKRILVTGGQGFVGSQLIQLLADRDDLEVVVLDNLLSGAKLNSGVDFLYMDIRDRKNMSLVIPQFDVIVHLAAIVGEPACVIDTAFAHDVNVIGTQNILNTMTRDQTIIFASTSSVYGNRPNERVTEESTPLPINNYGRQKYFNELQIQESGRNHIIVRPVTAFGITQRTRLDLLVNTLIYEALSTGTIEVFEPTVMRPIIHVIDFARILVAAIDNKLARNNIYNIGDPAYSMNKLELATKIAELCSAQIIQKDEQSLDPRNYDVAFDKLISTSFIFGTDRLEQAIRQVQSVQNDIAVDPQSFSTPHKVKLFLEKGV